MTWTNPNWLWALAAVAAAALLTLLRPARRLLVVGSLELWQRSVAALGGGQRRRGRTVSAAWLLLTAGAVVAVVAAAGPVVVRGRQVRSIAIALPASVETTNEALGSSAKAVLDRLGPDDRVQLLLPGALGGQSQWLSADEARRRIAELPLLPALAGELDLPQAGPDAQHTFVLSVSDEARPAGPSQTVLPVASAAVASTIERASAVVLDDGSVEVFAAVSCRAQAEPLVVAVRDAQAPAGVAALAVRAVPPGAGRYGLVLRLPPAAGAGEKAAGPMALEIALETPAGQPADAGAGSRAYLVAVARRRIGVAIVGRDDPLLRRFISIHPSLELVDSAQAADIVFANGAAPPAGKAALVIDPPEAATPPGWRLGNPRGPVDLAGVARAGDEPVLAGVDLVGIGVRRATPLVGQARPGQKVLLAIGDDALMLQADPALIGEAGPRRLYVALALTPENTNLTVSEAFVVLLDNAVTFLAHGLAAGLASIESWGPHVSYACEAPTDAADLAGWTRIAGEPGRGPWPWPGVFGDGSGSLRAVCIRGLSAQAPGGAGADAAAVGELRLPDPVPQQAAMELWPVLAILAGACWLAGWRLR